MSDYLNPIIIGQMALALLFLLLSIKCFRLVGQERVQRECLISLGLVLLFFPVGAIMELFEGVLLIQILGGLGIVALMILSLVFGILGLIRFFRNRQLYDRGRWQGILALILSGSFAGLAAFAFVLEASAEFSESKIRRTVFDQEQRDGRYPLDDYNLSFADPGPSWFAINPQAVNPDASLALTRRRPESFLMVIAETPGIDSGFTLEAYGQIVRANFISGIDDAEVQPAEAMVAGGIPGEVFSATGRLGLQRVHYEIWYGTSQGLAVQVLVFGANKDRKRLKEDHRNFLAGMELTDSEKIFTAGGDLIEAPLHFPDQGFSVNLPKGEWIVADTSTSLPAFAATNLNGGQLHVVRVDLAENRLDLNALAHGFAGHQSIDLSSRSIQKSLDRELSNGTAVRELVFWYDLNSARFRDHYRFYQLGNRALIVNTWNEENEADPEWKPEEILSSVAIHPELPALEYARMTLETRGMQANLLNEIGLFHYVRNRYREASELFAAAAEIAPENPVFAGNYHDTLIHLDLFDEALEVAEKQIERFPEDGKGRAMKARALTELDRKKEALDLYGQLFSGDFEDDDVLLDYLQLLIEVDQPEGALMVIEQQVRDRPSRNLRLWEGQVAVVARAYRQAEQAFVAIAEADGWDSQLYGEMVDLFLTEGDHESAWEWLDRQENQMGAIFEVWMGRGRSQLILGELLEAHVSFSQALERRPGDPDAEYYLDEVVRRLRLETGQPVTMD